MILPGPRVVNLLFFACCAGLMGFALFAQHVLLLDPCPLCVFQRVAVIGLGLVFLLAAGHNPSGWGRYVYAALLALFGLGGAGVAGWHFRLQNLPADEIPTCGPGLDYMLDNFPLGEALRMVFEGSGECAEVAWSFLGLSMPGWVFLWAVGLGAVGVWNNLRRA
jgi:disulfide bond formation protein DsbB